MAVAVKSIEKWQELGHQLNINPEKLSNLFKSGRSGAECRDEMIAYWEKHDNDASWEKLARALSRMGEDQLAVRIIKEHMGRVLTTPALQEQQHPVASTESSNSKLRVLIRHVSRSLNSFPVSLLFLEAGHLNPQLALPL